MSAGRLGLETHRLLAALENAEFLADVGESLPAILARLGVTRTTFEAMCRRHGRADLLRRLTARGT